MNTNQNLYEIWGYKDSKVILKCFAGSASTAIEICRECRKNGMKTTMMELFGEDDQEAEISLFDVVS